MSDIPPANVEIPQLPDELLCEVFQRCDGVTLQNVRRTCRHWSRMVGSYEFIKRMSDKWVFGGCSLIAHFGYSFTWTSALDWLMKLDSRTGETAEFTLPFLINWEGWFEILGVQNGVFCVRYCCLGSQRKLLIWNPVTGMLRTIEDPTDLHDGEPAFLYAFAFYPNSLDYAIIHVFYDDYETPECSLEIYTSFRRNWDVSITCPNYVHGLEPTYVTLDGVVYWISGTVEGIGFQSQYIVSFCIMSLEFRQIPIPPEAEARCPTILAKEGHIYVASNNHNENTYSSVMWRLDQDEEGIHWIRMYEHHGNGATYVPAIMADGAPIHVMEKHIQVDYFEDLNFTNFDICRFNEEDGSKTSLQLLEYDGDVDMRSMHTYRGSVFPV